MILPVLVCANYKDGLLTIDIRCTLDKFEWNVGGKIYDLVNINLPSL